MTLFADPTIDNAIARVLDKGGARITGINGTTRDRVMATVQETVAQGMDEGLGISEITDRLETALNDATAFNEARSELIARTETMMAYNAAALATYTEFGVERVQAIDGDQDPECAERDGRDFSIEEAADIEDHPNGTLDWVPFFGQATPSEPVQEPPDLETVAKDLVDQASAAEPQVTEDILAIGERSGMDPNATFTLDGKDYHTLDARLKTESSTLRKITGASEADPSLTAEQIAADMKDNLRYTYVAEKDAYNTAVRQGIEDLTNRGYEPYRATNYWSKDGGYAGLNTNWRTVDGQVFEVQFHTQRGLETKEVFSHPLYEAQRVLPEGSAEWNRLQAEIDNLWAEFRADNVGLGDMPWLKDYFPAVR